MILYFRESTAVHNGLKLAGVVIRRRIDKEQTVYPGISPYNPADYEVLLRYWPAEPYVKHLAAFSGPMFEGEEPEHTLVTECYHWSKQLAGAAGYPLLTGIKGNRTDICSVPF